MIINWNNETKEAKVYIVEFKYPVNKLTDKFLKHAKNTNLVSGKYLIKDNFVLEKL